LELEGTDVAENVIRTFGIPSEKQLKKLPDGLRRIENNTVPCIVMMQLKVVDVSIY
jgi:hypothetical protein